MLIESNGHLRERLQTTADIDRVEQQARQVADRDHSPADQGTT